MSTRTKLKVFLLWTALAILIVGGIVQRLQGPPAPVVKMVTRSVPMAQSTAATSFAEQVVFAYLTWNPDDGGTRDARLRRLGLVDALVPSGKQSVIYAQAGRIVGVNRQRAFVYVDTLLARRGGEVNITVAVPVTSANGRLGVFAKPTLLRGTRYPEREAIGVEDNADSDQRDALVDAAESFFKTAATTNDQARLTYFAAGGVRLHGVGAEAGSSFTGLDESQFEVAGRRANAYLTARIKNRAGDELLASYYLTFVLVDGRWLIERQTP